MNKQPNISAKLDRPYMLKGLVEDLARRRYDLGYSNEICPDHWRAVDPSSVESYVEGAFTFSANGEKVQMPFTTSFLFTCLKEKGWDYRLAWSISLS